MKYDTRKFARALEKAGIASDATDIIADALTEALTELEKDMAEKTQDRITLAVERGVNRIIATLIAIAGVAIAIFKLF